MSSALLQHTFSDYRNYNKTRKIENYYILLVIKRSIRDIYIERGREIDCSIGPNFRMFCQKTVNIIR